MAFDGIVTACIVNELQEVLAGGRIDKITQPERDEINIMIRNGGKNYRLLISASSSDPRMHITTEQKENPEKAPMFCMLLRKHLSSGKVISFTQPDFERVIKMQIESYDELGDLSVKTLVAEIMGRHSNIILADCENRVLGSIKHVDFTVSSVRQVLPGMMYEMPPSQGKLNPMHATEDILYPLISSSNLTADKFLLDTFTGIGPLNAREISFEFLDDTSKELSSLDKQQRIILTKEVIKYFESIKKGMFCPVLLYKNENIVKDYNATDIKQYANAMRVEKQKSLCEGLDAYFATRDRAERMRQKSAGVNKFVENNITRCQKKLALQQQKLKDSEKREKYKQYGDLIIANIHKMPQSSSAVELENYYDDMKPITISLIAELSPSQNAQRYYILYQKAKNAEKMSKEQIRLTTAELEYLESVKDSIARAENKQEIKEIQRELSMQGYSVRKATASKIRKEKPTEPHRFDIDGFEVFVGKNNLQNDILTLKEAKGNDLWFHVKSFAGSHTVLKTKGETPSDDTIVKVAKLAAYYSKARESANVTVDYTIIKNVKKPSGAKAGMVIYDHYNTVNVMPQKP